MPRTRDVHRQEGQRRLRDRTPRPGLTHGIRSSYVEGCRCDPCTDAEARYSFGYKHRRR